MVSSSEEHPRGNQPGRSKGGRGGEAKIMGRGIVNDAGPLPFVVTRGKFVAHRSPVHPFFSRCCSVRQTFCRVQQLARRARADSIRGNKNCGLSIEGGLALALALFVVVESNVSGSERSIERTRSYRFHRIGVHATRRSIRGATSTPPRLLRVVKPRKSSQRRSGTGSFYGETSGSEGRGHSL